MMKYKVILSEDKSYILEADDLSYKDNVVTLDKLVNFNNHIQILKPIATFNANNIVGVFPYEQ